MLLELLLILYFRMEYHEDEDDVYDMPSPQVLPIERNSNSNEIDNYFTNGLTQNTRSAVDALLCINDRVPIEREESIEEEVMVQENGTRDRNKEHMIFLWSEEIPYIEENKREDMG